MSDKPKSFDGLFVGQTPRSLINEPVVDCFIDYTVPKAEPASKIAKRRWFRRDDHERE